MERQNIAFNEFNTNIVRAWADDWYLLTAGDFSAGEFNTMTVAWGSLGVMWSKPFAQVVVRPSRYTHQFMEQYGSFTLSAFPKEYKKALNLCGTVSGRDTDKIKNAGLTPIASSQIAAPGFDQAELIIECKKMYYDDLKPANFLDGAIEPNYNGSDYHRVYFGEVLAIQGIEKYCKK